MNREGQEKDMHSKKSKGSDRFDPFVSPRAYSSVFERCRARADQDCSCVGADNTEKSSRTRAMAEPSGDNPSNDP